MYVNWQLCTQVGLLFGQMIPGIDQWGLDFAMIATFIGLIVPYLREFPMVAATSVSACLALMLHEFPHQLGLFVATLLGCLTGLFLENHQKRIHVKEEQ